MLEQVRYGIEIRRDRRIRELRSFHHDEGNPPASPDSFVTTQSTCQADQRAILNSVENGPCSAQICDRGIPARSASSKEAISGVIRKNHSRCSESGCLTKVERSLIPVAKKMR